MSAEDQELIAEFVVEANEHLENVESELLAIEAGGANVDSNLVNKVFRAVHSVKGAAGFLQLETINRLAHSLENVLNRVREGRLSPNRERTDVMLKAADTLRTLINTIGRPAEVDISTLTAMLEAISAAETPSAKSDVVRTAPSVDRADSASCDAAPSSADASPLETAGAIVAPAATVASPAKFAKAASDTEAAPPTASPETFSPADAPAISPETSSASPDVLLEGLSPSAAPSHLPASPPPTPAGSAPGKGASSAPGGSASSGRAGGSATPVESNIRVSVQVLDRLMNLAGELVLSRNQLLQAVATPVHAGLDAAAAGLDHVTSELQEAIMQTRMQPIGNVFGKFPRVVRDLSSKLGKQCELQIEGKDVEVDKTIIEAIGDPLMHLIRNAVDHGIELPAVRQAAGKRAQGAIRLQAYHKAGKVGIEISDDGAGIDPAKLRVKAVEKGVAAAEHVAKLSDRDAVRLIFHPGFSTAEKLSDVSGRGVGMDVVRTNIERLGGTVDVESQVGAGATIQVTLPLTLAIIPSMIIRCGGQRLAIPQANIAELVRLRTAEAGSRIGKVKSGEVLRLRGALLPLVRLGPVLGLGDGQGDAGEQPINIVVVESGTVRYGLVVDGISDSEEIVVKPLGRHLKGCGYLAGATILGDGRVALILDVAGIATEAHVQVAQEDDPADEEGIESGSGSGDAQSLLLFRSDPAEQFAVPMEVVSRIERVRTASIERVGDREVLQYRGNSLPLIAVEEALNVRPRPQGDSAFVIVFATSRREIGLIAPHLDDIREILTEVDETTFREPGVAGSLVVDERVTRLLDVFALAEAIHPEWFEEPRVAEDAERPVHVLLAEDSTFFRNQVARFFSEAGFEVTEAVDGQEAWDLLSKSPADFDIIVSDIEMPNMNGFEFCLRAKQNPQAAHLPVIALTSLSSDEHMKRGREVGFDDYQIKMHRDNLLQSVRRLSGADTSGKRRAAVPKRTFAEASR